jgi:hypothetical protein
MSGLPLLLAVNIMIYLPQGSIISAIAHGIEAIIAAITSVIMAIINAIAGVCLIS